MNTAEYLSRRYLSAFNRLRRAHEYAEMVYSGHCTTCPECNTGELFGPYLCTIGQELSAKEETAELEKLSAYLGWVRNSHRMNDDP